MDSINVKRDSLIEKMKVNRDKHHALFTEAKEGFRITVIEELEKSLKSAREGREIRTSIPLQAPQDHTDDYDSIIAMLIMSVDDEISLSHQDFQSYVLDKWHWAIQTSLVNSAYAETSLKAKSRSF